MIHAILILAALQGAPPQVKKDKDTIFKEEIVTRTNEVRANVKLAPVKVDKLLAQVAQDMASDLASRGKLSHTDAKGRSLRKRIDDSTYPWKSIGENIAMGYTSAKEFIAEWVKSETHKKNMLTADFNEIGIGLARSKDGDIYLVQVFASRDLKPGN